MEMAEATAHQVDSNSLPVFYYNDFLVQRIGDEIGLNLFEPRYQLMCQRMMNDGRFLFMPNFDNYQCCVGDVGFVIRLKNLQHNGRTFGIRGAAEQMVSVEFMWVEPDSHGLHYARFCPLPAQLRPIDHRLLQALTVQLNSQSWQMINGPQGGAQLFYQHPNLEDSQLLVSTNWERQHFLLLRSRNPEPALKLVHEALVQLIKQASPAQSPDVNGMVHSLPCVPMSIPLGGVVAEFMNLVSVERREQAAIFNAMQAAMSSLRLTSIGVETMRAHFPAGSLQIFGAPQEQWARFIQHSHPYLRFKRDSLSQGVVNVCGGASYFCTPTSYCEVTAESVKAAYELLYWGLNSLRICIILRARKSGEGALALLADNAAQLVCDFIAPKPHDGASAR